jgi:thymidylate synthase
MSLPTFDTLAEAYSAGLGNLMQRGAVVPSVRDETSVASGFGKEDRPSIELLGYGFELHDPTAAVLECAPCQPRLDYCFGLLTWSLIGSDDVSTLSYYHPAATRFSDDGAHLSGAFGRRLFRHEGGSQIAAVVARLKADFSSRRAIAMVLDGADNFRRSREFPCAASVQFFLRDGGLDCIVNMRAQQALFVLPYDAFLFIGLQAVVAAELEVAVGSYRHFAGTFHIYSNERELAETVLAASATAHPLQPPALGIEEQTEELRRWEERLRAVGTASAEAHFDQLSAEVEALAPETLTGQAARVFLYKAASAAGDAAAMAIARAKLPELEEMIRLREAIA